MRLVLLALGLLLTPALGVAQQTTPLQQVAPEWPRALEGHYRLAADSSQSMTLMQGGVATVGVRQDGRDYAGRMLWFVTNTPMDILVPGQTETRRSTHTLCLGTDITHLTCRTYAWSPDTIRADQQLWLRVK